MYLTYWIRYRTIIDTSMKYKTATLILTRDLSSLSMHYITTCTINAIWAAGVHPCRGCGSKWSSESPSFPQPGNTCFAPRAKVKLKQRHLVSCNKQADESLPWCPPEAGVDYLLCSQCQFTDRSTTARLVESYVVQPTHLAFGIRWVWIASSYLAMHSTGPCLGETVKIFESLHDDFWNFDCTIHIKRAMWWINGLTEDRGPLLIEDTVLLKRGKRMLAKYWKLVVQHDP